MKDEVVIWIVGTVGTYPGAKQVVMSSEDADRRISRRWAWRTEADAVQEACRQLQALYEERRDIAAKTMLQWTREINKLTRLRQIAAHVQ